MSSIVGPLVGGLFIDQLSWRWSFYINLPIALVALAIVSTTLHLPYRRIPHAIDFALGAGVLFVARQRRAPEPVVPLRLFADRVVRVVLALNLTSGILLFCGIFFLPSSSRRWRG